MVLYSQVLTNWSMLVWLNDVKLIFAAKLVWGQPVGFAENFVEMRQVRDAAVGGDIVQRFGGACQLPRSKCHAVVVDQVRGADAHHAFECAADVWVGLPRLHDKARSASAKNRGIGGRSDRVGQPCWRIVRRVRGQHFCAKR